ncbi:MAG: tRNA 2-thiouridine(34) synthase MnmA [Patescibacteria group bacterium]
MGKKVLLGMSGGVDSSVSAALLLEQGYEVVGAFMKNWSDERFGGCTWKKDRRDAMRVAAQLGIRFVTYDFEEDYRNHVVQYMFDEINRGRTPNPDVMCNKYIKFDRLVQEADKLGCDYIATGHYAKIDNCLSLRGGSEPVEGPTKQSFRLRRLLRPKGLAMTDAMCIYEPTDKNKDQTYFLWAITREVVPRILFPLGNLTKPEVRKIAVELNLTTAEKQDSTGVCFIGEINMDDFLSENIPEDPGDVITTDGKVIGKHKGINFYTIGQRHGLDIAGVQPYYVISKNQKTKELIVSSNYDQQLYQSDLSAGQSNWFANIRAPFECKARIRYRQELQNCTITKIKGDQVSVTFEKPQRAVTPGQSIVLYNNEMMLGGAVIE